MIGLYVHIPFCTHACPYCDFSFELLKDGQVDRLLTALENEAERRIRESSWSSRDVASVFIGGGTPTCLTDAQLDRVLGMIHDHFRIDPDAEITVEANPETVRPAKLHRLRGLGVNRLSIGVQSFSDEILHHLGRRHTAEQATRAASLARDAGFDNINLDLMFGVPGQGAADWTNTLDSAVSLEPEHVSIYGLTIEPGTPYARMKEEGSLELPDDEHHVGYYYQALDRLSASGYRHYEVSNMSKPGMECRHNLSCWNGDDYLGLGPSAHSHRGGQSMANARGLADYLSAMETRGLAVELDETLTEDERIHEYILLSLRSTEGMDTRIFRDRYGSEAMGKRDQAIHALTEEGLLARRGSRLCLTRKGLAVADSVCEYLL